MKEKINKRKIIIILVKILFVLIVFLLSARYVRKIYILNNSYTKYEKSVIAEIVDSNVSLHIYGYKYHKKSYKNTNYTLLIEQTNEKVKLTDEFSDKANYQKGEKVLLSYYEVYDKKTNKYIETNYSIKTSNYFENGSFFGFSDNASIFYNTAYPNKIINFENTEYTMSVYSKKLITVYSTDNHVFGMLMKDIGSELVSIIKSKNSKINVEETPLGTVYDFEYNYFHYSVLNYGSTLNDSLVLRTDKVPNAKNIMDFIKDT